MATYTVEISGFRYNPADLVIEEGDSVTWINKDSAGHTATRRDAPTFDTGTLARNEESDPITFNTASSAAGFEYFCAPHTFMTAKIIVVLQGTMRSSYSLSAAQDHHAHDQEGTSGE